MWIGGGERQGNRKNEVGNICKDWGRLKGGCGTNGLGKGTSFVTFCVTQNLPNNHFKGMGVCGVLSHLHINITNRLFGCLYQLEPLSLSPTGSHAFSFLQPLSRLFLLLTSHAGST